MSATENPQISDLPSQKGFPRSIQNSNPDFESRYSFNYDVDFSISA